MFREGGSASHHKAAGVSLVFVVGFSVAAVGCLPWRQRVGPAFRMCVEVARQANQRHPVAVDLVLVHDKALVADLLEMPASEWFAKREQLRRDLGAKKIEFASWEWAPGQTVTPLDLKFSSKGRTAFLFANYLAPGEHRFRLPDRHFHLTLGEQEAQVTAANAE